LSANYPNKVGPESPAFASSAYTKQQQDWQIVNDCFSGSRAIHTAGNRYLPQHEKETPKAYAIRLKCSTYWNAYKRTVQGLVGMVFRKDPALADDVPQVIAGDKEKKNAGGHAENIDLRGSHLDVFSKEVFKAAINDGHTFIFVDMPPALETQDNPDATLADEREAGIRPYWIHYTKDQVKNWRTISEGGALKLDQVSICEEVTEPKGRFGEEVVTQYRVLVPGAWEIWRKDLSGDWYLYQQGFTSIDFIPLVIIATNQTDFMVSSPPLLDLAHENLRHYRLQSDLDNILHKTCVPVLVEDVGDATGGLDSVNPEGEKVERTISPNTLYRVGKGGSLKYTEITGEGPKLCQEEIAVTKKNMAVLGLTLLASKPSAATTATENVLDYEAETSELAAMARNLEDGLEQALKFHANYLGKDSGGSVEVNRDFASLNLDPQMVTAFANMVAADELPLETLWALLEKAQMLPPDFDPDEAKALIAAEIKKRQAYPTLPDRGPLGETSPALDKPGEKPAEKAPPVQ
jgi:hypothetical protein